MAISLSSPVTGGAQTGFTSPTYTHVADTVPASQNAKAYAVTALGGTQTGARISSPSDPFLMRFVRPIQYRPAPVVNANGVIVGSVPNNVYSFELKKGVYVVGTNVRPMHIDCRIAVPAGADSVDPANIRAAFSMFIGSLWQLSAGIGDSGVSGVF
jgi:IMP dehydrogenase/GMP reductase